MSPIPALRALVLTLLLSACGSSYLMPRQQKAAFAAEKAGWSLQILKGTKFDVASFAPPRQPGGSPLVVYIEGDGLAYLDRYTVSPDPTPDDPMALRLALLHPGANAIYLARPCQYSSITERRCDAAYWTGRRYSAEIIESIDRAIDEAKRKAAAPTVILVGYSGGGAVAVLLTARRTDVAGIVTIAANLDLGYWTGRDRLAPLAGSLDPADVAERVSSIPQIHFAGARDDVVGADVVQSYVNRMRDRSRTALITMAGFDHRCCWASEWPRLSMRPELARIPGWTR